MASEREHCSTFSKGYIISYEIEVFHPCPFLVGISDYYIAKAKASLQAAHGLREGQARDRQDHREWYLWCGMR